METISIQTIAVCLNELMRKGLHITAQKAPPGPCVDSNPKELIEKHQWEDQENFSDCYIFDAIKVSITIFNVMMAF